jgi:2-iminoacetate synthase ThiH
MVLRNEVTFKLIPESIESLIKYYRDIYYTNLADIYINQLEIKKLYKEFIKAINKFVYYTYESALEELKEDGSGELLNKKSKEIKTNIFSLL